jgi:hypothetical protein
MFNECFSYAGAYEHCGHIFEDASVWQGMAKGVYLVLNETVFSAACGLRGKPPPVNVLALAGLLHA